MKDVEITFTSIVTGEFQRRLDSNSTSIRVQLLDMAAVNMGELNTILGELGHVRRELQALALSVAGARLKCQKRSCASQGVDRMGGRRHNCTRAAALVLFS